MLQRWKNLGKHRKVYEKWVDGKYKEAEIKIS